MRPVRSPKLFYALLLIFVVSIVVVCGSCFLSNPVLVHYVYAPFEAPFCAARVAKELNVAPNHSAIIEYYETNLKLGMPRSEVLEAFSLVAPIGITPGEHCDYIVFQMCSEPLNNLIFWVCYTDDGKLMSIEEDTFP